MANPLTEPCASSTCHRTHILYNLAILLLQLVETDEAYYHVRSSTASNTADRGDQFQQSKSFKAISARSVSVGGRVEGGGGGGGLYAYYYVRFRLPL